MRGIAGILAYLSVVIVCIIMIVQEQIRQHRKKAE